MSTMAPPEGTYVISWAQTEIDGHNNAPISSLDGSAVWIWRGEPVRLDDAIGFAGMLPGESRIAHRRRAAASARRIVARALDCNDMSANFMDDLTPDDRVFRVTDGHRRWTATLIEMPGMAHPLLVFAGTMPPADTPLYVSEGVARQTLSKRSGEGSEGVVCFTPGTLLETPGGLKPVETLVAGDLVVTKDNGIKPIVWVGDRNVSGARLYAMPDLRPVRICEGSLGNGRPHRDLTVSPDHRLLVTGKAARALWGDDEVLVSARDLVNGAGIRRDMDAKSVIYYHLMLEDHQILVANGVETESFHPAAAKLDSIADEQRQRLYDVMPELANDPATYGPTSRRMLSRAEAAMMPGAA